MNKEEQEELYFDKNGNKITYFDGIKYMINGKEVVTYIVDVWRKEADNVYFLTNLQLVGDSLNISDGEAWEEGYNIVSMKDVELVSESADTLMSKMKAKYHNVTMEYVDSVSESEEI